MPDLDKLYSRFGKQGLVILGLSDEDAATVRPFLAEHSYSYPILLDPGRRVSNCGYRGFHRVWSMIATVSLSRRPRICGRWGSSWRC
jgi:peroxiredoxin